MKKTFLIGSLLLMVIVADSHEFWLQVRKFRYNVGDEMKVDFVVGENFMGEYWDMTKHKAEKAEIYFAAGVTNLTALVQPTKGKNLSYKFLKEGTHVVAMQSNPAFIELEAQKFNDYLKEDGLDNILDRRTSSNSLDKPAKEFYQRFAKLIVQSGKVTDDTYKKRIGFKLEIVPLANPYTLKNGDYLDCRVFYQNKPVPHQMVKVWSHIGNRIFLQNIYTEDDGSIRFPISSSGPWMVSSVMMVPSQAAGADYQSMWASLVFEIE